MIECNLVWIPKILKNGKPSVRFGHLEVNRYTRLMTCDVCGKLSTPKKIQYRPFMSPPWREAENWWMFFPWMKSEEDRHYIPYACMGCWNKYRRYFHRIDELYELKKLVGKLRRTRRDAT